MKRILTPLRRIPSGSQLNQKVTELCERTRLSFLSLAETDSPGKDCDKEIMKVPSKHGL